MSVGMKFAPVPGSVYGSHGSESDVQVLFCVVVRILAEMQFLSALQHTHTHTHIQVCMLALVSDINFLICMLFFCNNFNHFVLLYLLGKHPYLRRRSVHLLVSV